MSEYLVVSDVSKTLRWVLWDAMEQDPTINGIYPIIHTDQDISFEPPFQLVKEAGPDHNALSLYLFRVAENGDCKNRPFAPETSGSLRCPPLALTLNYLITPLTNSAENDQKLLGKTMQVLYDHAIISDPDLHGVLGGSAAELRLTLNPMALDDLHKLWSAFLRPLRLSVAYEVKVVFIDSQRLTGADLVRRKRLEFTQM